MDFQNMNWKCDEMPGMFAVRLNGSHQNNTWSYGAA